MEKEFKEEISKQGQEGGEGLEEFYAEKKIELEKKRVLSENEKLIREQLEQEIKTMKVNPQLDEEAEEKAKKIKGLGEEAKLKELLIAAQEKGVAFAVGVAKKINDAALLDYFHDILAKHGLYKKLPK